MPPSQTLRILRLALVVSVVLYAVLAVALLGPPVLSAPWWPTDPQQATLLSVLILGALGCWSASWLFGQFRRNRETVSSLPETQGDRGAIQAQFLRFLVPAALAESGALLGLVAGFILHDSRLAIVAAVPAVLLILLAPGPRENP